VLKSRWFGTRPNGHILLSQNLVTNGFDFGCQQQQSTAVIAKADEAVEAASTVKWNNQQSTSGSHGDSIWHTGNATGKRAVTAARQMQRMPDGFILTNV